ncbi:MAG TPA: hypothetical protein VNL71_02210 [Chloroflexota bacterium]|nr:hypothetical protein [Chloroflexota bacterium]
MPHPRSPLPGVRRPVRRPLGGALDGRHIALKVVVDEDETSVAVLYQCRSPQQANEVARACLAVHGHLGTSVITSRVDTRAQVTLRRHLGQ